MISKDDINPDPHYYLVKKEDSTILDITFDHYTERDIEIPYYQSKGNGLR